MYWLVYLALSLAATVSVDIFDNADGEWIAPGYSISEDILINPFDYVTNIKNDPKNIACHAFFVDTEDGEMWRVIMVGSNRMVVLQENRENPMVVDFPFDAYGAVYSRGGRFVIIRDGELNTADEALHIDIDNNIVRSFDPTPDGQQCGLFLSDNGTVAGMGTDIIVDFSQDLSTATVRHYDETYLRFHCTSAYDEIIVAENAYSRPREIVAFDWDGNELWTVNTGDRTVNYALTVSPNGSKIGVSFARSGAMIIDVDDGRIFWESTDAIHTSRVVFSPDAYSAAYPASMLAGVYPYNFVVLSADENDSFAERNWYTASPMWHDLVPRYIDNNRNILFIAYKTESVLSRYCLSILEKLIWTSEPIKLDECSFQSIGNTFNLDWDLRCPVAVLSKSDTELIYHSQEGIRIMTIVTDGVE